jgi:hypothetical protein
MTAPARTPRTTPTEAAPQRTGERRPRTAAAERAYARRAQREGRTTRSETISRQRQKTERGTASRASFVVLVMGLLVGGVITTLWLSTQAIADSYRLDDAKRAAAELGEKADGLQREVAAAESAPQLAERAKALGMIPAGDPARLIVQPDGTVVVVGEPKPVASTPPPPPPADQVPLPPIAPDQAPPEQPADQGQQASPAGGDG